ncbi:MAG: hypothetical protein IJG94_10940 [Clostridia bacterium]|nr:hypothetical protein [Clostridia bacterium]
MIIKKGEKVYHVEDAGKSWTVKRTLGGVDVKYTVDKALAPDAAALEAYIAANDDLF